MSPLHGICSGSLGAYRRGSAPKGRQSFLAVPSALDARVSATGHSLVALRHSIASRPGSSVAALGVPGAERPAGDVWSEALQQHGLRQHESQNRPDVSELASMSAEPFWGRRLLSVQVADRPNSDRQSRESLSALSLRPGSKEGTKTANASIMCFQL